MIASSVLLAVCFASFPPQTPARSQFATAPPDEPQSAALRSAGACDPVELTLWQPGLMEAQIIASENLAGTDLLYPDPAVVERIADDLAAIRAHEPFLALLEHQPLRRPGYIRLFVDPAVWPTPEAQCLLDRYPGELFEFADPYRKEIDFHGPINFERIRAEWLDADGVAAAFLFPLEDGPKFIPVSVAPTGTSRWKIDRRFGEFCTEACECSWVYIFRVTESGAVTLRDFNWTGAYPWCAP